MHSLGAFGAWRKKCQTREKLQRRSLLSSADRLKKETARTSDQGCVRCYKDNLQKDLRTLLRLIPDFPSFPSAIGVTGQEAQLTNQLPLPC